MNERRVEFDSVPAKKDEPNHDKTSDALYPSPLRAIDKTVPNVPYIEVFPNK